jgi:hypothetical protein
VGTVDNAAKALDLYNESVDELAAEDPPSDGFVLSIVPEYGGTKAGCTMRQPAIRIRWWISCYAVRGHSGCGGDGGSSGPIAVHVPGSAPSADASSLDLAGARRFPWMTTDRWLAIALDGGNPDTGGQGDDLA